MKRFVYALLRTGLFWIIFFAFFRLLFVWVNYDSSVPSAQLFFSFWPGLRLDLSFTGYLLLLIVFMQLVSLPLMGQFCKRCLHWPQYFLVPLFSLGLLADVNLYRYWGSHLNSDALSFLQTPGVIFDSLHWVEVGVFFVLSIFIIWLFLFLYKKFVPGRYVADESFSWKKRGLYFLIAAFAGALLIVPIRGTFGVAPINTGVAYFSNHLFANHAAINPLWNLAYSLKRADKANRTYNFMTDDQARQVFDEMMGASGDYPELLRTSQPDIVVILLESFSSQAVESLGGEGVTLEFDKLMREGIFFENVFSASVRSDFGLVGTLCGYPGLPGYSIMQYPEKSKHLSFVPQRLQQAGYVDCNYLYGGDMGFKNMRSLITLAGFDDVVTMDDFPVECRGEKWGVHDEYTFERFFEMIENSRSPSFNFFFTLSSHEPFDVPGEKVHDDPYLNSVHYTDQCLGSFFDKVKENGIWENTLFILVSDHGIVGPRKAGATDRDRFHIPMLWTGGALAVKDTVVSKYASQVDIAATLLPQLDMEASDFMFSKNIFDRNSEGFAFFQFHEGIGYIDENMHHVFDVNVGKNLKMEGVASETDSLKAKAFLQVISNDFQNNK